MNLSTSVANMATALIATKKLTCEQKGGRADLGPMLDIAFVGGERDLVMVHDRDDIELAVIDALDGRTIESIGFLADAYVRRTTIDPEDTAALEAAMNSRGLVSAAFHAGDPAVVEALVVTAVEARSNAALGVCVEYHYDDDDQPRFDKPVTFPDDELDGAVVDNLRAAISAVAK